MAVQERIVADITEVIDRFTLAFAKSVSEGRFEEAEGLLTWILVLTKERIEA
jgi:hypothetical protein